MNRPQIRPTPTLAEFRARAFEPTRIRRVLTGAVLPSHWLRGGMTQAEWRDPSLTPEARLDVMNRSLAQADPKFLDALERWLLADAKEKALPSTETPASHGAPEAAPVDQDTPALTPATGAVAACLGGCGTYLPARPNRPARLRCEAPECRPRRRGRRAARRQAASTADA